MSHPKTEEEGCYGLARQDQFQQCGDVFSPRHHFVCECVDRTHGDEFQQILGKCLIVDTPRPNHFGH
jgi:hypothetical protein